MFGGTDAVSAGGGALAGRGVKTGAVAVDVAVAEGAALEIDGGGLGPRIAPAVAMVLCCNAPGGGTVSAAPQCTQKRVPA